LQVYQDITQFAKCQFCNKFFVKLKDENFYYEHVQTEHTLDMKLSWKQCNKCDNVFRPDESELEKHQFEQHCVLDVFILCRFCGSVLFSSYELRRHLKEYHPAEDNVLKQQQLEPCLMCQTSTGLDVWQVVRRVWYLRPGRLR
jgi:hypothetical protein